MSFTLDAYAARSCPLKTVNLFTPNLVAPSLERPDPPFFRDADAIEAEVMAAVLGGPGRVVDLRPLREGPSADAEAACLEALASGADVVIAGLLPKDEVSHRRGRPSLLVRSRGEGGGYHPVQVKFHRVLEADPDGEPLDVASLTTPRRPVMVTGRRFRWGSRLNAALQMAHYWRLLEACGYAARIPWAGLVGIDKIALDPEHPGQVEQVITWLNLGQERVPPDPRHLDRPEDAEPVSTLARYDDEHRYRVELAQAALASSGQDQLLTPILSSECRGCVWQEHCQAQLDADDLSLRITKAPLDVHEVRTLRRLGISTVAELAHADLDDLLGQYLPRASHRVGSEERLRRAHRRATLMDAGVQLERQTQGPLDLPRHDLEIDVDIETSSDDRVYLWGFWVDDPSRGEPYGRQFATFADLDDAAELDLARRALGWLRQVVAGRDAAVYHYSDYEVIRLNRLAHRLGEVGTWATTWAADGFVDLFEVVRRNYFGANGLGLKVVTAAVTGFAWRDEDPGGLNSQSWFAEAVGDPDERVRELARVRVLEYNEDDVRATWHLRRWLREQA